MAITLGGAALRFATLGQGLWFDEAGAVREISGNLAHLWAGVRSEDLTPPLYVVCLWFWRHVFGESVFALRAMSALCGTLIIPVTYAVADRLVGRRAALIAALLTATSPVMVYYSQEIRTYALTVLLCSVGVLAFLLLLEAPDRRRAVAWAVVSLLALASHYYAVLVVVPQAAVLARMAWRRRQPRILTAIAVGSVVGELALLAWLERYQAARAYHYCLTQIRSAFVPETFTAASAAAGNGAHFFQDLLIGPGGPFKGPTTDAFLGFCALALVMIIRRQRDSSRRGAERAVAMVLPALVAAGFFQLIHFPYNGRYMLVVWAPLAVVLGAGLSLVPRAPLRIGATAALCGLSLAVGIATATVPRFSGREDTAGPARAIGVAPSSRLIAIDQQWDLLPLRIYRPDARSITRPSATVRELDLIAMPSRPFPAETDAVRPPAPRLIGLPRGMHLERVILGPTYVIERYVSPVPVKLPLAPAAGVFGGGWRFLYEPAGASFGQA